METINGRLQNRYTILGLIGQGGLGYVYEGHDERLNSRVAIKQLKLSDPTSLKDFEREAQLLASLKHAALPKVIDHFTERDSQFLVMEYVAGQDLADQLQKRPAPFTVPEVVDWADQLLTVLIYLHSQQPPIIHRDIKPGNMKVTADGTLLLLDFGLAKGGLSPTLNPAHSVYGYTPRFAPLEQIQATGTSVQSDLYSAGATVYELLANQPFPDALTRAAAVVNQQPDPIQPLSGLNPAVPAPLSNVVMQALSIHQNQRPLDAQTMRVHLRAAAAAPDNPVAPTLPAGRMPAAPPSARHRWPLWLGIALALLVVGAWLGLRNAGDEPTSRTTAGGAAQGVSDPPVETASLMIKGRGLPQATLVQAPAAPATTSPLPPMPSATALPAVLIQPASVQASSAAESSVDAAGQPVDYTARLAVDGREDTAWRTSGDGVGEWIMLSFAAPVRVSTVRILPGYAKIDPGDGTDRFSQNRRVLRVRLEWSDGRSQEALLQDRRAIQTIGVAGIETTSLRIVVLETTVLTLPTDRDFTPISEIEVLGSNATN